MTVNHCDDMLILVEDYELLDDSFDDGGIDEVLERLRVILLGGEGA